MAWNLEDYETVESRLVKWWEMFPMGRIQTELISATESRFIVITRLYRDDVDSTPYATGLAEETISDRGVNSTSALENAETSSIGRAISNGGIASKKRPSRQEMEKVARIGNAPLVKPVITEQEKAIPNEPQTVVWDVEESKAFSDDGDFLKVLNDTLGAEPITYGCKHGNRVFKSGESKANGKPWAMWACIETRKANQCEPMWGKLSDGKWLFELKAVNHG
jgi:hypothetical protein